MTSPAAAPSSPIDSASAPGALAPVATDVRIQAIDATRGFALLGIFLVNIITFSDAFGTFMEMKPPQDAGVLDLAAHYFTLIFCTSKFYPLFSLLFGMGLMIQWRRAAAAGRSLLAPGLRRLLFLGLLGLLHALLLWYGDILFVYSTVGLLLLFLLRARPRTLALVGGIMLGISVLLSAAIGGLMLLAQSMDQQRQVVTPSEAPAATEPAEALPAMEGQGPPEDDASATPLAAEAPAAAAAEGPFERLWQAMREGRADGNPAHPFYVEAEREAYRQGPFLQAFLFRAMTWVWFLIYAVFGMWWHIAAMFLFGAAMLKMDLFAPQHRRWHVRFVRVGLLVGLPLAVVAATVPVVAGDAAMMLMMPVLLIGGPLLSLAYLGGITLLVQSGKFKVATDALAATGRMALTNYLLQTILATGIFYWWGLGWFGRTGPAENLALVVAIYLGQVAFSIAWLSRFRFGPMEWLWRSVTYLKLQPLRRLPRA